MLWPPLLRSLWPGDKGEYDRAIADYNSAIRLNPQHMNAYNNRAKAYEKTGDSEQAAADQAMYERLKKKESP